MIATLRNLAILLLRLAGAPFIAPALRQAGWSGHATIFRLLGIDLRAAEAGLWRGRGGFVWASHPACRLDDQPAPAIHRAASARHVGGCPVGAAGATGEVLKRP